MRFAFKTSPQHTTWPDMLDTWREGDRIELFESGWNFDHFYPIFSDSDGPCMEGWVTLSALAQATSRLRVGCLVTGNPYRHPAVLANMATTLDIVSGGRLELGIGAGWNEQECTAYGIDLGTLTERFDRFDEAVEVLVGLMTQEYTDFSGRYYRLTNARCEPKPVQQPHPPVVIGGTGRKRTLRTAARWAQHWNHPGAAPAEILATRDVLHEHCAAIGRNPSEITVSTHLRYDPEAGGGALAEQAAALEGIVDLAIVYVPTPHTPAALVAIADAVASLA
jgi:F420-dependent oxidoreductase-like protein